MGLRESSINGDILTVKVSAQPRFRYGDDPMRHDLAPGYSYKNMDVDSLDQIPLRHGHAGGLLDPAVNGRR